MNKKSPYELSDAEKKQQIEDMWNKHENESDNEFDIFTQIVLNEIDTKSQD